MCSKSTLDKILKEVSNAYKKVYGDKLVKAVLYGSYARGDYDEESDIDIVGIIKKKSQYYWDFNCIKRYVGYGADNQ